MDTTGGPAPEAPGSEQAADGSGPATAGQQAPAPNLQEQQGQPVEIEVPAVDALEAPMSVVPAVEAAAAAADTQAEPAAAAADTQVEAAAVPPAEDKAPGDATAPMETAAVEVVADGQGAGDAAQDGNPAAAAAAAAGGEQAGAAPPASAGGTAGGAAGGGDEDDELAASLLSNMAAWQTELDTFQAALRRCMESTPNPAAANSSPAVDETGRGAARLMHSGPKGITGYRGVTQHKRTKRFEANVWMDHKQMYLGAFDAPEQAAHAHDIGALCSGKARAEALNFPLTDYDQLLPMLYSLPHAQVVAALRGYGRLPTARPPGGISSGRLFNSPSVRSASAAAGSEGAGDGDDEAQEGQPQQRPRRLRGPQQRATTSTARQQQEEALQPMDWHAALLGTSQQQQQQQVKQETDGQQGVDGQQQQQQQQQGDGTVPGLLPAAAAAVAATASSLAAGTGSWSGAAPAGGKQEQPNPAALALAQQAHLQALSAALTGGVRVPSALSGAANSNGSDQQGQAAAAAAAAAAALPLPLPAAPIPSSGRPASTGPSAALLLSSLHTGAGTAGIATAIGGPSSMAAFEAVLWKCMSLSHQLGRPEDESGEGSVPRPLHSGPKGQSGFKGVTLYKRCQRYNAHIWLGKQTHIGTFHTAEQAAVAHDVMELWRNEAAQGLNFAATAYGELVPLLKALSEADALTALRNYSRSPAAAAAAAANGATLPGRSAGGRSQATQRQQAPSAGASSRAAVAAAAAQEQAAAALQAPSLRRRHRKPQHQAGGQSSAGGARSDDSSGGSVPAQRQSAGSLMWYMLERERAGDDDFDDEPEDPDFSPAEAAVQTSKRMRPGGSESPSAEPLSFQPRTSLSVTAALAADIPAEQTILGARPPRPGSSHRWGVAVSLRGQAAWFGRLDRQRAAVAADLALAWRRCTSSPAVDEEDTMFNVPAAGYEQDGVLMDQLRRIKTAPQLCQFMAAVIPQDPPAAPFAANAGAVPGAGPLRPPPQLPPQQQVSSAAVASLLLGGRKRKQQALLEESRAAKHLNNGNGGTASPFMPPLPPAAPLRSGNSSAAGTPTLPAGGLPVATAASAAPVAAVAAAAAPGQQEQQQEQVPENGALAEATAAMAAADVGDSDSMLSALRLLVAADKGGRLLQDVVAGWGGYPLMQQQDLFGALKLPVSSGDWDQLEDRLQVALDLASLF